MLFHKEEITQSAIVEEYCIDNQNSQYKITWHGQDSYICTFLTTFHSENGGELEIEENDPRYDEFLVVTFRIVEILADGKHRYNEFLSIDYRDFPDEIIDTTNHKTV